MKIGYLGPGKSTFGYMAAKKFFSGMKDDNFLSFDSHKEICQAACKKNIKYGIVAAENVIEGIVTETIYALDTLSRSDHLLISGEVEIPIELFLLRKINDGSSPTRLLAHPIARKQCSRKVDAFLKENTIEDIQPVNSNGKAAEEASKDSSIVAISTTKAEEEYGLVRLEPHSIVNNPNNFTRFWVVSTTRAKASSNNKTCFLVNLNQEKAVGLKGVLEPFSSKGINLLLIAPIPIHGRKWEYSFLIEFSGSFTDPEMRKAYDQLCESGITMGGPLLLGSYPAGTTK